MIYNEVGFLYARAVWLLFLWGRYSILKKMNPDFKFEEWDDFATHITSTNGRMRGQEVMFISRVPSALPTMKLLWEIGNNEDYTGAFTRSGDALAS